MIKQLERFAAKTGRRISEPDDKKRGVDLRRQTGGIVGGENR